MEKVIVDKECSCNGKCGEQCRCKTQEDFESKRDATNQALPNSDEKRSY